MDKVQISVIHCNLSFVVPFNDKYFIFYNYYVIMATILELLDLGLYLDIVELAITFPYIIR